MSLLSLFIKPADGSACGGGFCRHDENCTKTRCEGHPKNTEAAIRSHPVGVESALPIQYAGNEPEIFDLVDELVKAWPLAAIALACFIAAAVVAFR